VDRVFRISSVGILNLKRAVMAQHCVVSTVKSHGCVAALTWQFASRWAYPGFVHFLFPLVPAFALEKTFPLCCRINVASPLRHSTDSVKCVTVKARSRKNNSKTWNWRHVICNNFPSLHFSVIFQITNFSYGWGLDNNNHFCKKPKIRTWQLLKFNIRILFCADNSWTVALRQFSLV
jgi:hypothetical protein